MKKFFCDYCNKEIVESIVVFGESYDICKDCFTNKLNSKQTVSLYSDTLTNEIEEIIKKGKMNCMVQEFQDNVDWYWISANQKLSEEFIEKFQDKVHWICISRFQKLSEKFIEKHQYEVDWYCISKCQKLSEEFIEKFQDKVHWDWIVQIQKLSEDFRNKWKHKLK